MSNPNDGGPAFPMPACKGNDYLTGEEDVTIDPVPGMSLRDWFAGMALSGEISSWVAADEDPSDPENLEMIADNVYRYADEMLKIRKEQQHETSGNNQNTGILAAHRK